MPNPSGKLKVNVLVETDLFFLGFFGQGTVEGFGHPDVKLAGILSFASWLGDFDTILQG